MEVMTKERCTYSLRAESNFGTCSNHSGKSKGQLLEWTLVHRLLAALTKVDLQIQSIPAPHLQALPCESLAWF